MLLVVVAAAVGAVLAAVEGGPAASADGNAVSIYTGKEWVRGPGEDDTASVELGTVFSVSVPGAVSSIRFYKTSANTGTHIGSLWSSDRTRLASVEFAGESEVGWQTARLSAPVRLVAGRTYTVSYHAEVGRYAQKQGAFADGRTLGNRTIRATSGVYRYSAGPAFPSSTWNASAYYVDVLFTPGGDAETPPPSSPSGATPQPSAGASTTGSTSTGGSTPGSSTPGSATPGSATPASPTPGSVTSGASTSAPPPGPSAASPAPPACAGDGAFVWANLAACNWPGPGNTGPNAGNCPGGLTANGGAITRTIALTTPGAVVSCQRISGCLSVQAQNVVIRDVEVVCSSGRSGEAANGTGVIYVAEGASAVIERAALNGSSATHACIWHQGTSMSATAIDCSGVNDGIFSWAYTAYSATTGDHFAIRDSYFHDFTTKSANGHIDGYQTEGAGDGLIEHNTFLMTSDGGDESNSAIAIWNGLRSSHDILVRGNLIAGGGFAVYAEDYNPSEASPAGGASVTNI